jgi:polygalacturonase
VDARRLSDSWDDGRNLIDLTAFNTDGFDVTGNNVWIHDCNIWNQDDCIAVKDGSQNMLFERINASGVGLTIGSIGGSTVRNITFRDCHMHHTFKGIYLKFREDTNGLIADVLYENIFMDTPEQWPIWIGPAQQADSSDLCAAHPCSLCWPTLPGAQCNPSLSTPPT